MPTKPKPAAPLPKPAPVVAEPFTVPLASLTVPQLYAVQHHMGDLRSTARARAREVQRELDGRVVEMAKRHAADRAQLGQVNHPPTQSVF